MKVPHFEKIPTKTFDVSELTTQLYEKVGVNPLYFEITDLEYNEASIALHNIEEAIRNVMGNSMFPYPVYVICPHDIPLANLEMVRTIEELPDFFNKKTSRLKAKESQMLKKTMLLAKKIKNLEIENVKETLAPSIRSHRELFHVAKENTFYEDLLDRLKPKDK